MKFKFFSHSFILLLKIIDTEILKGAQNFKSQVASMFIDKLNFSYSVIVTLAIIDLSSKCSVIYGLIIIYL